MEITLKKTLINKDIEVKLVQDELDNIFIEIINQNHKFPYNEVIVGFGPIFSKATLSLRFDAVVKALLCSETHKDKWTLKQLEIEFYSNNLDDVEFNLNGYELLECGVHYEEE